MGKNSKSRRDAKAKVRQRQGRAQSHATRPRPSGHHHDRDALADRAGNPSNSISSVARPSCSNCGSNDLSWTSAGELAAEVSEDRRDRVHEGVELFGADADAWLCADCDTFGLMGPSPAF